MKKNSALFIVLMVFLGGSIAGNFLLYRHANKYYTLLNEVRLDPFGLSFYENDRGFIEDKIKVAFFGDSRAEQWTVPKGLGDFTFLNRGVGGQTSIQVVGRFNSDVLSIDPDILIVQVCINDLKTIALFPRLKRKVIDSCKRNIEKIVGDALSQGISVVLTTVFPRGEIPLERKLYWSESVDESILEVNQFIKGINLDRVHVYDAWMTLSGDDGVIKSEYSKDTLHLNEVGYAALNKDLKQVLLGLTSK